ncbi:MAG: type II toxin-antitoxin system prevent-host-death family antitoxin [Actinomycetota bacterium]|nr:type II toxin-antitoxin system prevent-host-death family antitoxin [Actinomycetota bacterium]
MREIPQRDLRNNVSAVLREVEEGHSLRITVRGRPVADLVPIQTKKRGLSAQEVQRLVADAPLDPGFLDDVAAVVGERIDEL